MCIKVFTLPFDPSTSSFDDREVRQFIQSRTLLFQSDYLVEIKGIPYIAIVIRYKRGKNFSDQKMSPDQSPNRSALPYPSKNYHPSKQKEQSGQTTDRQIKNPAGKQTARPAYQPQKLSDAQMKIFESMRRWRYARAKKLSVPAYAVCSNRELEEIILTGPRTIQELSWVKGFRTDKLDSHGQAILQAFFRYQNNTSRSGTYRQEQNNRRNFETGRM